jgi:hypothetical protein
MKIHNISVEKPEFKEPLALFNSKWENERTGIELSHSNVMWTSFMRWEQGPVQATGNTVRSFQVTKKISFLAISEIVTYLLYIIVNEVAVFYLSFRLQCNRLSSYKLLDTDSGPCT